MKKFYLLLLLMLVGVGSAWATATIQNSKVTLGTAATSVSEGWYLLKNVGRASYATDNGEEMKMTASIPTTGTSWAKDFEGTLFYISASATDGKWYIKSGKDGYFTLGQNTSTRATTAHDYEIALIGESTDNFYLWDVENSRAADGNEYNFVGWSDSKPTSPGGNDSYQIIPVTLHEMPATGYYHIQNVGSSYYMQTGSGYLNANAAKTGINTIFNLTKNEDGTYYIKGDNGTYVQSTTSSTHTQMTTTACKYDIKVTDDGKFEMRANGQTGDYQYLHSNSSSVGTKVVGWAIGGDGSRWTVEDAGSEYTYYPVTVSSTIDANMVKVATEGYTGSTLIYNGGFYASNTTPTDADFAAPSSSVTASTTVSTGIDVTLTDNNPTPIFSVSDASNNYYYYIKCTNATSYYLRARSDNYIGHTTNKAANGAGVFQFYEAGTYNAAGYKQYYIYNTAAQAYVSYTSTSNGKKLEPQVREKANAKTWTIITEASGTSFDVFPGEVTNIVDATPAWNVNGGFGYADYLGLYDANDGNSSWTPESVTLSAEELATLNSNYVQYVAGTYTTNAGQLGYLKESTKTTLEACASISALETAVAALTIDDYVTPSEGHYYKIQGRQSGNVITSTNNSDSSPKATMSDTFDKTGIFYFDGTHMISYATGYRLGKATWGMSTTPQEDLQMTFDTGTTLGYLTFKCTNSGQSAMLYDNSTYVNRQGSKAANTDWKFTEITELPVTITSAGYATFSAPVKVKAQDDYTVYTVQSAGTSSASLTQQMEAIPANCGVIIKGEEGTCTMTIAGEEDPKFDSSENMLVACVEAQTIDAGTTAYILAKVEEEVGFYLLNSSNRTMSGHKCYLTGVPSGVKEFLSFNFDDATAISQLTAQGSLLNDGKFLENGKIVIIKNGVKYNVAGQLIK